MKRGSTNGPTRTCVGCGARDAQAAMIRLRLGAGTSVVPAATVAGGRSAYVHDRTECIGGLVRSKGLGKSLRATISKPARLELSQSLAARCPASHTDHVTVL